ncbi:DUF7064 domain-containing protein [Pseudonocardia abyssalis]|uniref:Uncharacterized protein n=1 Tax=Pseudonocardia abyssalis TaxID=2792008 RepID=A0ABS6UR39_9PSEU|nr:hypothetical protein [Pseudonocardia abyssalis]MBW0116429.1 hypothetical protein [Pseudonocardia abyssalis]MBW0134731.1 hypothetical protein [Pseudonocardia abyssalis]
MIRPEDAQFHAPTSDDPLWAETNYFGLYAGQDTDTPMNIGVYGLFREPIGVVGSTVSVNSRRVTMPWAADYWDAWEHLVVPQPSNLLDYRLANGLKVVCSEPNKVWDVDYSDPDADLELHFRFTGLSVPYDVNDPEQDPMAADKDMDLTWGHAYAGHFDLTGHVEGEIRLRGATTPIDCVSTMDHSWGVRAERQTSRLSWLHAHFSTDFAVHALFDFGTGAGPDGASPLTMTHGYVLDHGELHGLKAGGGTTHRAGFYPDAIEVSVTDSSDRTWDLEGTALTTFPWQAWPGTVGHNALLRWTCGGQTGYGECMDFIGLGELGAAYHRVHGTG